MLIDRVLRSCVCVGRSGSASSHQLDHSESSMRGNTNVEFEQCNSADISGIRTDMLVDRRSEVRSGAQRCR